MNLTIALTTVFIMSLGFDSALAEEYNFEIANPTIIFSPDSAYYRILVKPEMPFPDTNKVIDHAALSFWVVPMTDDSTYISVRLFPISLDWNLDDVTWENPWMNPGGDYSDINYSEYAVTAPGEQVVNIDLTGLCMGWADGTLPYHGLMIMVSESSMAGLTFLNGQDNIGPFARLFVSYTNDEAQ
jgi:hypothetical protein